MDTLIVGGLGPLTREDLETRIRTILNTDPDCGPMCTARRMAEAEISGHYQQQPGEAYCPAHHRILDEIVAAMRPLFARPVAPVLQPGDSPENPITHAVTGGGWGLRFVKCGGCGLVARCTPRCDFFLEGGAEEGPLYCEGCLYRRRAIGTVVEIPAWMLAPPVLGDADNDADADSGSDLDADGDGLDTDEVFPLECRFCESDPFDHACVADVYEKGQPPRRIFLTRRGGPLTARLLADTDADIDVPVCLGCGCTDQVACDGGCHWMAETVVPVTIPGAREGEKTRREGLDGLLCSCCAEDLAADGEE